MEENAKFESSTRKKMFSALKTDIIFWYVLYWCLVMYDFVSGCTDSSWTSVSSYLHTRCKKAKTSILAWLTASFNLRGKAKQLFAGKPAC